MDSAFTRFWKTVAPPPSVPHGNVKLAAHKRRQRRLIGLGSVVVIAIAGGWATYAYVSSAPERAGQRFQLGMSLMKPGSYQDAITLFDRAISIWPQSAEYFLERGIAHQNLGQIEPALADFQSAVTLDPGLVAAYSARGALYQERGDNQRALQELTKSIQLAPTVDGYFQRGQTYESLGQHQKAVEDYDNAIALERSWPYVYRARALAKANLGDRDGAEGDRNIARQLERR